MSGDNHRDRTIALAGIFQGAALARQLARRGYADEAPMQASVRSILITDAVNTVSVFGGLEGVRLGLLSISRQTGSAGDLEVARYVVSLCQLAKRFYGTPELVQRVAGELATLQKEVSMDREGAPSSELFERFADLYKANLSQLKPQIMVQGEQGHLGSAHVVDQIRTALLAGVRAGVLFHQLGGSRWQLLFQRRLYIESASRLLEEIEPAAPSQVLH